MVICSIERELGVAGIHVMNLLDPGTCRDPTGAQSVIHFVVLREWRIDFVSIFVSHRIINIYCFPRIFNTVVEGTCYSRYRKEEFTT